MTAVRTAILAPSPRRLFINSLVNLIGGKANLRVLWLPDINDGLRNVDSDLNARQWAYDSNVGGRIKPQGRGYALTMDGTANYVTSPDTADLSFGNGSVDVAFSIFAVFNVTTSATDRVVVSKYNTSNGEWRLTVNATTNRLQLGARDESAAVETNRLSDATITVGSWCTVAATYNSTGGATNMNGALIYSNGAAVASTATNNAGYVAMENLGAAVEIGSRSNHGTTFFLGQMGLVIVTAGVLSANQIAVMHTLSKTYFNI